jgi:hypothetical protein
MTLTARRCELTWCTTPAGARRYPYAPESRYWFGTIASGAAPGKRRGSPLPGRFMGQAVDRPPCSAVVTPQTCENTINRYGLFTAEPNVACLQHRLVARQW